MNEHDMLAERFKNEADMTLFRDMTMGPELKKRILAAAVQPAKRTVTTWWRNGFVGGTLVAGLAGLLLLSGLNAQPKPSPTVQPATPIQSPAGSAPKAPMPAESASVQNIYVDRTYPTADAVPAKITYQVKASLPAAPRSVRSFRVNDSKLTLDEAQRWAQRFGFAQPLMKRFNDSFWAIGRNPQGQTITDGWPDNKNEPGTWLHVWESRHIFWWTKPTAAAPPTTPTVAWMEDAVRRWLGQYGLSLGEFVEWRGELNPNSLPQADRLPMLLWQPTIDGFAIGNTMAHFEVAGDGTVAYASVPLWQLSAGASVATKSPEEALSELKGRTIRLDQKNEHTVTIEKVELVYADPSVSGQGNLDLFYCFSGHDDNGQPFNQYIYARKDKTGLAPWERP